jgi:hypothetical protein
MFGKLTKKIKVGSILLSEWSNKAIVAGKSVELPNVTISRLYLSKQKEWKHGYQFRIEDLDKIYEAIDKYRRNEYEVISK